MGVSKGKSDVTKQNLFDSAVKSNWEDVVNIYRNDPLAHTAKMVISGETALHIAVSDGNEEVVEGLVEVIREPKVEALMIGNERGNTPLHLAASMGNIQMCRVICRDRRQLLAARNADKETPLFLAALHGHRDTFLFLHLSIDQETDDPYDYCRRADGKTILHCAIAEESFDLAFLIIHHYGRLVYAVDEKGNTPLHVLAGKPTAFRSGTHLLFIERIIYRCIYVEKLENEYCCQLQQTCQQKENLRRYPENYHTCVNLWNIIIAPGGHFAGVPHTSNRPRLFPPNYDICLEFIKFANKAMMVFLGLGFGMIRRIKDKKEKNSRSVQVLDELLQRASSYGYDRAGRNPQLWQSYKNTAPHNSVKEGSRSLKDGSNKEASSPTSSSEITDKGNQEKKKTREFANMESPILIAAKNGIKEMVENILEYFPVAIHDRNSENKNLVLLAVENRQPEIYGLLLKKKNLKDTLFRAVDNKGNSALHLAAMLRDYQPWHIPGAALQMQWEIRWFKYVKHSMPRHFFSHYNDDNVTPKEIFTDHHSDLLRKGGKWLQNTSSSCSVVATLIATVAFATSATIPGSFNEVNGRPNFEHRSAFNLFAVSSLVALCFSVTALVMFLAILTSRHQEENFHRDLPEKLLFGLTALFISISAILVSFCAGHFFILRDELNHAALPVYAATCLPISFFALVQFPLYFDVIWTTFRKVPQRRYKVVL